MCITYEYQCRVQILVILLDELLIVLLGLIAIVFIELGTEIFWRQLPVRFASVRVNDDGRRNRKLSLPIRWTSAWFPVPTPLQYSSMILAVIGDQRAGTLGFP
jgi:hypothetical protein